MHRISKKVVTLHARKAIWWLKSPDARESGESLELYLQL